MKSEKTGAEDKKEEGGYSLAQKLRLWEISSNDELIEIPSSKLNLEDRIENWLEDDISIVYHELLVIGRQLETDFGGVIDLLCLDQNGDIVIVELKRDKTPREITAQILDYASWVGELTGDKIEEIAKDYLGENSSLEEVYFDKFKEELPEVINESHKMLVVASEIDASSERIIKYLSDWYGVDINAVTFHYFKDNKGKEYLSRVYMIEPEEVEYKSRAKSSKKLPPLTFEEFQSIAEQNGVALVYKKTLEELSNYFDTIKRHRSGVAFKGIMEEGKSPYSILVLYPKDSDAKKGLLVNVYLDRLAKYFGLSDKNIIKEIFPPFEKLEYKDWAECEVGDVYFNDEEVVEKLLSYLTNLN